MKQNIINKKSRFITILLLLGFSSSLLAQTPRDAYKYSEYDYIGSARTFAMGNAFTALGGDLGSININPAGSATAGFSQVTVSPGFNISESSTKGFWENANSYTQNDESHSTFRLPNVGFVMDFQLGNNFLNGISVGFVSNITNVFSEKSNAFGTNRNSSFLSALAQAAGDRKISNSVFDKSDCFDQAPFDLCLAYRTGMISNITGEDKKYLAVTEDAIDNGDGTYDIMLKNGGGLDQNWGRHIDGSKNDYVFNVGFNFSKKFFFGVNVGITDINYEYEDFFKESAIDPSKYNCEYTIDGNTYNTRWKSAKYGYQITTKGTGVYGKFGFIYTPTQYLRVGAAIQTPTYVNYTEKYRSYAINNFDNSMFGGSEDSPTYHNKFSIENPMRANFGIAGIIGKFCVISVDYECSPYDKMEFNSNELNNSEWEDLNNEISKTYTIGHNLRIGTEFNIANTLFARAGYNLLTDPFVFTAANGESSQDISNIGKFGRHTVSVGLGYSSKNSFFADFALAAKFSPSEYFYPYDDIHDISGTVVVQAPELLVEKMLWTGVLTLGWRF